MGTVRIPPFGTMLRRHRRATGLTQAELAERAGLSLRAISDLERGVKRRPRRETLRLLADALRLSPADQAAFEAARQEIAVAGSHAPDDAHLPSALPIGGFLGAVPEGPIVARASEIARLRATLEAVAAGSGRLALLVGEPGVGKTRLAQEVMLAARHAGFLVATGRCYELQQTVAYYPFLDALHRAYIQAPAAVRAELPVRWAEVARLLPDQDAGVIPTRATTGRQDEQQHLFWQITGFLGALCADRPVALLLDDLHWADEASLDLLQHLARHTREQRVLLLGTYRDVEVGRQRPLEAALRDLGRERLVERVPVRRLSPEGTAGIIRATLDEAEVSSEFRDLLHARTEGNPFFTQEILRALVERGDLYRQNHHWEWRAIAEIKVPVSVRSAIGQRTAHLSVEAQDLLHEASVLGQTFSFGDLLAMSGQHEEVVGAALDAASGVGLVRETGGEGYTFVHALIHQTLLEELPGWRRRRLHRAAGEALERLPDGVRRTRAVELAQHFREGDEGARALPYALLAGDRAEAVYAHAEGEAFYRMAVELAREAGDPACEAQALEQLGAVLNLRSRYDEARGALDQAEATYRTRGDAQGVARVLTHLAYLYAWGGTPAEGITRLSPAMEELEAGELSTRTRAALALALSELYAATMRQAELLVVAARAEGLARSAGDDWLLGQAVGRRGLALLWTGRAEEGAEALQEAAQLSERAGDLYNAARDLNNLAFQYQLWGQLDRCAELVYRALEIAERRAHPQHLAFFIVSAADVAFTRGDWQRARQHLEQARTLMHQTGTTWTTPYELASLGRLDLAQGKWQSALPMLEEAIALGERSGDLQAVINVAPSLAERDLLTADPPAARRRLEPLIGCLEPGSPDWAVAQALLAWASLEAGDERLAEERLNETLPRLRERMHRFILVDALRVQALLAVRWSRWRAAEAALDEALALSRAMPYPYAEAKALYVYGQLHVANGEPERAREPFEQALAILNRLGERLYAEHIERALAELPHQS